MEPPRRVSLPHVPPAFVPSGSLFFITVCTTPRGENQLAYPAVWAELRTATEHYHIAGRWHVPLLLAMPDHLHLLAGFAATESMPRVVAAWKHFLSQRCRVTWQRDFFDHRLRIGESHEEKARYIRNNPVRAGLVATPEAWPYVWTPESVAPLR
ncbi:MAG: hypothetical protein Q8N18_10360 [Opitutaceae bacterium]|nr:hypothetical protein [Opitutaceae bacterium]